MFVVEYNVLFKVTVRDFVLGTLTLQSARTAPIENSWKTIIVVMFIAPPPVSFPTFLPKLSAQNTVKTVSSSDFGFSGNTDVLALFICVTAFCACAVSMSNTLSYDPQWPKRFVIWTFSLYPVMQCYPCASK